MLEIDPKELQQGTGKTKLCYPANHILQMHYWVTKNQLQPMRVELKLTNCPWFADINFFLLDKIQTKD